MSSQKILVVTVMRLGDTFQHLNLIGSIQKKHGFDSTIDMVVTDYSEQLIELKGHPSLDAIRKFFSIPYSKWQKELTSRYLSIDKKIQDLLRISESLSRENYDFVYNLSNTDFSYRLLDLVESKNVVGAYYRQGKATYSSSKVKLFLDEYGFTRSSYRLSLVEALANSLDLQIPTKTILARRSLNKKPKVLFQVTTSDQKKKLTYSKWKDVFRLIQNQCQIEVLSSASEFADLQTEFLGYAHVKSLTIKECFSYLNSVDLVVSLDTSILHLAALNGINCLGVFLGSGHKDLTAPFVENAKLISAKSDCYPCSHSQACSQSSHLCEQSLTADEITKGILSSLSSRNENRVLDVSPNDWANQSGL